MCKYIPKTVMYNIFSNIYAQIAQNILVMYWLLGNKYILINKKKS